jgi:MarR family transcriptional regulator, lower aerobic nicotinate degradation pathway regulator
MIAIMARGSKSVTVPSRATDRPGDTSPFAMGLLFRRAHQRAAGALVAAMRPYGLELRHFGILIVLADQGPTLQRDLVAKAGFDKAAIGRSVDDLQDAGLVTRAGVPGDRRVWMVEITNRGREVFDDVHVNAQSIADDLVAHLKPGESELLIDLLTRYIYPDGIPD